MSQQMLNVIVGALGKQPYQEVAQTFAELQRQLTAQQDLPPKPKSEDHK